LNRCISMMGSLWRHSQMISAVRQMVETIASVMMNREPNQSSYCPLSSIT
jgi:hypothetical protein